STASNFSCVVLHIGRSRLSRPFTAGHTEAICGGKLKACGDGFWGVAVAGGVPADDAVGQDLGESLGSLSLSQILPSNLRSASGVCNHTCLLGRAGLPRLLTYRYKCVR